MTITITTKPTYALPGRVPLTVTSDAGNFVRFWVTAAPRGSRFYRLIKQREGTASRVEAFTANNGEEMFVDFEVPGEYAFTGQEYIRGTSFGAAGGFKEDPRAFTTETKQGSEDPDVRIHIGQRLEQKVGILPFGQATLVLYVWDETVRETSLLAHGEDSPILVDPQAALALSAIDTAAVLTAVADLSDKTLSTLTTNLSTLMAELVTELSDHFNNTGTPGSWHATADTTNDTEVENLSTVINNPIALARAARIMSTRLRLHMLNDEDGEGGYHTYPDVQNLPLALVSADVPSGPEALALAVSVFSDCVRAYEAHRVSSAVHSAADTDNSIGTTIDPILKVHKEFVAKLAEGTPSPPAGVQKAVVQLSTLGFKRT